MTQQRVVTEGDPWGDDADGENNSEDIRQVVGALQQRSPPIHMAAEGEKVLSTAVRVDSSASSELLKHNRLSPNGKAGDSLDMGPPPLWSLCLISISRHLEDYESALGDDLRFLPPHARCVLIAVAKRRGLLGGRLLSRLADEFTRILDLSGCMRMGAATLTRLLPRLTHLEALDLSGARAVCPALISAMGQHCPLLRTLRLGRSEAGDMELLEALIRVLPRATLHRTDVKEAWENVEDFSPVLEHGTLQSLRFLSWPGAVTQLQSAIMLLCPHVLLTPTPVGCTNTHKPSALAILPEEADSYIPLDHNLLTWIPADLLTEQQVHNQRRKKNRNLRHRFKFISSQRCQQSHLLDAEKMAKPCKGARKLI